MYRHNNELYHWGIKGMKWGVRRYQNSDGSYTAAGKKRRKSRTDGWSDDAKEAWQLKKKKLNQMSNAELQKLNKRQELENKYHQNNKSSIAKGIAIVGVTAAAIGTLNNLYVNGDNAIKNGKKIAREILRKNG